MRWRISTQSHRSEIHDQQLTQAEKAQTPQHEMNVGEVCCPQLLEKYQLQCAYDTYTADRKDGTAAFRSPLRMLMEGITRTAPNLRCSRFLPAAAARARRRRGECATTASRRRRSLL